MLDHPLRQRLDLSTLRSGIMAGATCPIEVMCRVVEQMHMAKVQIVYSMTETSPVSLQTSADDEPVPRHYRFVEQFPMTVTGKVQKFRMHEISIEALRRG